MFISAQVQGLNIPMTQGTMADIHESSFNESFSSSQGMEQDEKRYDSVLTQKRVFMVPFNIISYVKNSLYLHLPLD